MALWWGKFQAKYVTASQLLSLVEYNEDNPIDFMGTPTVQRLGYHLKARNGRVVSLQDGQPKRIEASPSTSGGVRKYRLSDPTKSIQGRLADLIRPRRWTRWTRWWTLRR